MKWGKTKQEKEQETVRFMLYLPRDLMVHLEEDAKKNYRSTNAHVRYILDKHFEQEKTA